MNRTMRRQRNKVKQKKLAGAKLMKHNKTKLPLSQILGQGGQGIVYKRMLPDVKIIVIKKSKLVDANQVEQFINEIVMLSQSIHINVVKLLGCCPKIEVPLLVNEFICNGTLFNHIHDKSDEFPLSWNTCLKIDTEVGEALA
ncbi:wall-associated receptor kinase-like 1 [Olea europaea var. sylvestris]|uniref:wall-associated receptor kinase-like 1 n=1 Tax=Olea europaea var. sylvestris TaxID=158386 RepID=UPI000C1CD555|nr:wall-associated receptor kinase-like 1 [Olea europaea var. sylvestris]